MDYIFRHEEPGDEAVIRDLVRRAFIGRPYADGDEQDVIDRLRADGDLLLSLVAVSDLADGAIIGQISYSPALLANGEDDWVVLGPVAVDPEHQGKGVGRALIEVGEAIMRARGKKGITVLGDPALYARFGFVQNSPMWLAGELGWAFQVKSLGPAIPNTEQRYVRAFDPPAP